MAQYQSFPDAAGDSRTLEKLKALKLPDLAGRSFLDVGCNEGFFCGFAMYQGARRVVGLDHSALFVERARRRFPRCEFFQQGWEQLPDGTFDVILLASALHYADDQAELIDRLLARLSPDGLLVLELGIVSSPDSEWIRVKRGIDEREFPTMPKLRELLAGHAWKWTGPSVSQDGDPVPRHVLHVSRRRPVAYLLMQPPGFGKSTIAAGLFGPAGIPVVSGDQEISLAASGKREAPRALQQLLAANFSPYRIDQVIQEAFAKGAGEALVKQWLKQAGSGDFALDAYVPEQAQAVVVRTLNEAGYLPIVLGWERPGSPPRPDEDTLRQAEAYFASMGLSSPGAVDAAPAAQAIKGYVDALDVEAEGLVLKGWAATASGAVPEVLTVKVGNTIHLITPLERHARPDVQRHLGLSHAACGFKATVPLARNELPADLSRLEVFAAMAPGQIGSRLGLAAGLRQRLAGGN